MTAGDHHGRSSVTGPTVPVSGPEDGACSSCGGIGGRHDETAHLRAWSRSGPTVPVVADTTAGEAETCGCYRRDLPGHSVYCPMFRTTLAARSGGAQDDGLRGRIEALAEEWEHHHRSLDLQWCADRLRRALTGPDDPENPDYELSTV